MKIMSTHTSSAPVTLHGYHYSVYLRIARIVLAEKGVAYDGVEIDPFADEISQVYLAMHPFGRVPTLDHNGFILYETAAITRYIDERFDGPPLQPTDPHMRARMVQIISIIDSYGYWPMVRQVFSHTVFRPHAGELVDQEEIQHGLEASSLVLSALESLVQTNGFLVDEYPSLADLHLAPMVDYFTLAPEGAATIKNYPKLYRWWESISSRKSLLETDPGLPSLDAKTE